MEKLNLAFYLKKDKVNQDGESPIYVRIEWDGTQTTMATKLTVNAKRWEDTRQLKLAKRPEDISIRDNFTSIKKSLAEIVSKCHDKGLKVDADFIKSVYQKEINIEVTTNMSYLEAFDLHNLKFMEHVKAGDNSPGSLTKYLTVRAHLGAFINEKLKAQDIKLNKLNFGFIEDFELFLKSERGIAHNTTIKYIQAARKIINDGIKKYHWLNRDPFSAFKKKIKEIDTVFLTEEEVDKIYEKEFESERLTIIKDLFIFCCFCGYAPTDLNKLTKENLVKHVDGEYWLMKRRQKTNIECNVMLMPQALAIIEKYKNHPDCIKNGTLLPKRSNQKMNEYLKEIGVLCGINKELHYYVSRHTFGTLMLTYGVPLETVSKMMGHKRLTQTQHYARLIDKKVSSDLKTVKKKFQKKLNKENKGS